MLNLIASYFIIELLSKILMYSFPEILFYIITILLNLKI